VTAVVAALSVALGLASLAHAQTASDRSDPAALKLMAECKAASGGAALDKPAAFHETGTIVRDGKAGTYEMYADLHRLRTAGVHTLEGTVGGGGYDGTRAWNIGPDGKVAVSTDPAKLADEKSGAYVTVGGYFYPDRFPAIFRYAGRREAGGRRYDVVEVTPDQASPVELWLDVRTHRVGRLSARTTDVRFDGEILQYRVIDGTWIAFKNRQNEGDHTMVQTLATYDYVALDPSRFTPPSLPH
jgi:hypothetical protein